MPSSIRDLEAAEDRVRRLESQLQAAQAERDEAIGKYHRARDNAISANNDKDEANEKRLDIERERGALREALKPFAAIADKIDSWDGPGAGSPLYAVREECENARAALRASTPSEGAEAEDG